MFMKLKLAICLILVISWPIALRSQSKCEGTNMTGNFPNSRGTLYKAIPEDLRKDFIGRLRQLTDYRRARQWKRIYGLLSTQTLKGRSTSQFIDDYRKYPGVAGTGRALITFVPHSIVSEGDSVGTWMISGCAKLKGIRFPIDAFIVASRENDEWRFSDIDMLVPRDHNFTHCSYELRPAKALRK